MTDPTCGFSAIVPSVDCKGPAEFIARWKDGMRTLLCADCAERIERILGRLAARAADRRIPALSEAQRREFLSGQTVVITRFP
jgi:hypothetical protein